MANITYLFGAGASCKAIPMAKEIPEGIKKFTDELKQVNFTSQDGSESRNDFIEQANDIIKIVLDKGLTIDSYASEIVTSNSGDLNILKTVLSCYLIYEQVKSGYDKRYGDFFKKLLISNNNKLPEHVKIISWNYDTQFELAYSDVRLNTDITNVTSELNADYYKKNFELNKFGIVRLNGIGTCLSKNNKHSNYTFLTETELSIGFYKTILGAYQQCQFNQLIPGLKFAWEDNEVSSNNIEKAINIARSTEILAIIGYSFHEFNRNIDRQILSSMTNLQRIYLTLEKKDYDNVIRKLKNLLRVLNIKAPIENEPNLEEFNIPAEM